MLRILLVTLPLRVDDGPAMMAFVACHERISFKAWYGKEPVSPELIAPEFRRSARTDRLSSYCSR